MDWLQSGSDSKIMWMYGRAGAGKSVIAQSIADLCSAKQFLAASFFWFQTARGRNDETRVIITLAHQLVQVIPEICPLVEKAIEEDSLLLSRPLEKQLEELIIKPLNKAVLKEDISFASHPRFIILDGLDECGTPSAQCRILRLLLSAVNDLKFPLCFLVASRPEKAIEEEFSGDLSLQTTFLSLDETYPSDTDIGVFLETKFKEITETDCR
ncbi:hypothetical protein BDZ97DRAFT_1768456 [Flammula alnicola]|nr:hypothetical protein BDZ97DRAFT_1768456 [Flammula alnicola]